MPTMPSSFASAAAGQSANRQTRNGRPDGGSGDWSRKDPKTSNGVLFRRSSTALQNPPHPSDEPALPTPSAETSNPIYESSSGSRYSKTQLLEIYAHLDTSNGDVGRLFESQWDPGHSNGTNGRGWGKTNDTRESYGPDVCWDTDGHVSPIGLRDMTQQEKEDFAGDVNSPLKPPPQNATKESNTPSGVNGRKTSVSHGAGNFGLASPAASRPGTRRRETSDSVAGGLASPALTGRFQRDEPSPFFTRKMTEKDGADDHEGKTNSPFGTLMRSNTATSTMGNAPSSPWGTGPATGGMSPMGNFGSFALPGAPSIPPTPSEKRPPFGSVRGESRLAHLMPEKSAEDAASKIAEKSWRSRPRTDTDPFGDDSTPAGSAALGGGQDESPPANRRVQGLDTPVKGSSSEFGMSELPGFPGSHLRGQNMPGSQGQHGEEPLSPDTNPYRSPPENRVDRGDMDEGSFENDSVQSRVQSLGGIPEYGGHAFNSLSRAFPPSGFDGSDRSQTSSVNGSRAFPSLGGLPSLGSLGGWPASGNPMGTPEPQSRSAFPSAFGNSLFGPMGDLQSPSLGGLGGVFGPGASNTNSMGRGSKLGSLFPAAMQAQMQGADHDSSDGDIRQGAGFGAIGRNAFTPSRETDSPLRTGRGNFEDLFPAPESRVQSAFSSADGGPGQTSTAFQSQSGPAQSFQQSQTSTDAGSNQLPTAQQRMMVMPDRMRWVYLDPQGQVQGPWSGLEMHDWYKASFFTADLSVKKVEDAEFEPLGQLIRRIGNSREPFLVPQIGIPHGPASTQPASSFASATAAPAGAQPGAVQPPFAGAFPSFGTTLTAEQQNNLERRKQEEQYLMARQREFLAQQQVNMKQMQMSGLPSALHHQSSIHSLQSQPSFSSMTSPIGMPPQGAPLNSAGFFDSGRPPVQTSGLPFESFREDDLSRLSLQDRQQLFNAAPQPPQALHAQQPPHPFGQAVGQQREVQGEGNNNEQSRQIDAQGFKARLHEFEQLRAQHDMEEAAQAAANAINDPIAPPAQQQDVHDEPEESQDEDPAAANVVDTLSLTQQVQKAASAKESPAVPQPDSPWAKVNTNLPMPFPPPPQSSTPLPAPTAQRSRTNLPEALNVQSRSRSETPEIVSLTPSLAPWAKEQTESSKGPSLKEIQEAEAKKAAKAEEIAAAARRALHEQEMKQLAAQPSAPAPGLPTTSTWGTSGSPATPSTPSAWVKPAVTKAPVLSTSAASKKTLAEIQREEELRKHKLAAAAAASIPGVSGGKRYADLASKTAALASAAAVPGPAWSTVGAGGKVKMPTSPTISSPVRAASSAATATPTAAARVVRPTPVTRSTTTSQTIVAAANEELVKWAKGALAKDLNSAMDVDQFVQMLLTFPLEASIISESIYSVSMLIDGRRFAEEFIRRRKLADKGVVEPANVGPGSGFSAAEKSGGWSEVAKKGPPKEEPAAAGFKVVPNKKKGKK